MGACNFIEFAESMDYRSAFNSLVSEAKHWHGDDCYNGTISTCNCIDKPVKIASEWNKEAKCAAYEYANEHDFGEKWYAQPLDCGKNDNGLTMFAFYGWAAC